MTKLPDPFADGAPPQLLRYPRMQAAEDSKEAYLLLVLSDGNLPTGSFVASSGLESTAAHALFHVPGPVCSDILSFLRNTVDTYARSAIPFARDAHRVSAAYVSGEIAKLDVALGTLTRLDAMYDASTLNHVARRASLAQGAALLTLFTKGFTRPPILMSLAGTSTDTSLLDERESRAGALVAALKLRVRGSGSDALGHLPVCWGILAAALGLTVGELTASCSSSATMLHIYTHRPRSTLTPFPPCARRALCGRTSERFGSVCCTAASFTRGATHC
jgi:urease accessory protein UreF